MKNYFTDEELHLLDATEEEKSNMYTLRDRILNPARVANGVIVCTSGHRNKEHNAKVRGSANSRHMCRSGYAAADLSPKECTLEELFYYIKNNFSYAELILEWDQNIVHVALNVDEKKNIKRTSIRKSINGNLVYYPA